MALGADVRFDKSFSAFAAYQGRLVAMNYFGDHPDGQGEFRVFEMKISKKKNQFFNNDLRLIFIAFILFFEPISAQTNQRTPFSQLTYSQIRKLTPGKIKKSRTKGIPTLK